MTDEALASHFDRLRGRVLGLIESWGLSVTQERGCKQIYKSLTYDMEAEITARFLSQEQELMVIRHQRDELMGELEKLQSSSR